MNKVLILATAIITLMLSTSCQKPNHPHSDHPFNIEISKVRADGTCVDIIPDNNDFGYMFTVLPKEYVDAFKGNEAELIAGLDQSLKDIYIILTEDNRLTNFAQNVLYNGAYQEYYYNLSPDSEYCVVAFAYTGITPDRTLTTLEFKTMGQTPSDINFQIEMNGSLIDVRPSTGDNYFYTVYGKENVEKDCDDAFDFHEKVDKFYWEEDFFPNMLDNGNTQCELTDYFETLNVGDQYYLTASGYDNGINSDIYAYLITYNGIGIPGTVTAISRDD